MAYDFDLFVIGGGSGGTRCARIAAGHGARVGVAEERHWGGTCVNVGCVPKKLMVMASEHPASVRASHAFGWDTQPGRHDWATLVANKDAEVARLSATYRRLLEGAGATVFEARARLTGPHSLDVGGKVVTAERIVLAAGGRPVRPNVPGAEHAIVSDDHRQPQDGSQGRGDEGRRNRPEQGRQGSGQGWRRDQEVGRATDDHLKGRS